MGKSPKEWQVYERRNRRLKKPSHSERRFPALSWHRVSLSKRWRLSHQSWAWAIVLLLAAGVWIEGQWDRGAAVHSPTLSSGRTVSPRDVIDGDMVGLRGQTFRLVGFNTPETGRNAQCAHERELGDAATIRLQTLIKSAAVAELLPMQWQPSASTLP